MTVPARRQTLVLLGLGVLLCVGIWVFSPWLTGHAEPWDAELPIWVASWLVIGVAGGCTGRLRGLLLVFGYALGQMLITIRPVIRWEFPLGWTFILVWTLAALAVSLALVASQVLVSHVRRKLSRKQAPVR